MRAIIVNEKKEATNLNKSRRGKFKGLEERKGMKKRSN